MATTVDDETILEVLRSNDAPRMTTTEVAGKLPVTRGTTRTRLQRLVDDGLLERKTEGNNVVWWLPERADELDAWEAAEDVASEPQEEDVAADEPEATEEEAEPEGDADDADETTVDVEVEATEQAKSETEDADTAVEVEAVDDEGIDEVNVTTPDEETETRTGAERSELSEDEEGLQALALLAAAIVVFLLFRKLLHGDSDGEETE